MIAALLSRLEEEMHAMAVLPFLHSIMHLPSFSLVLITSLSHDHAATG